MKLLCFDQSTAVVGWSLFEDKELIDYGFKEFSKIDDKDQRLFEIKQFMDKLIKEKKAEVFAIENIQLQYIGKMPLVNAYRPLAELIGVIKEFFYANKYAYVIVESTKWKSYCKIKGRKREEQKLNAQKFVESKYNIKVSEDTCDAICIGEYVVNKVL